MRANSIYVPTTYLFVPADGGEFTPVETDTSVTKLPRGRGQLLGVELGSSMVCEAGSPRTLAVGGRHVEPAIR